MVLENSVLSTQEERYKEKLLRKNKKYLEWVLESKKKFEDLLNEKNNYKFAEFFKKYDQEVESFGGYGYFVSKSWYKINKNLYGITNEEKEKIIKEMENYNSKTF